MIIEYHCECNECGAISVFPRETRYTGERPQVHLPHSVAENTWQCGKCKTVWALEIEVRNITKEFGDDVKGDMPKIEGMGTL